MSSPRRAQAASRKVDNRKLRRFEIEIEGLARAKGRPRFNGRRAYTPDGTHAWEEQVAYSYMERHGKTLIPGPVRVEIEFNQKRGDLDNLAKAILDGLNGVAFLDDAQVCVLNISRPWEPKGRAHTWIAVEEMRG